MISIKQWMTDQLILPKLLYLTLNLTVYSTHTFTAMYFYQEWHLEIWHYGFIGTLAAIHFITSPIWGRIADRTGKHRFILLLGIAGYATSFGLLQIKFQEGSKGWIRIIWTGCLYGCSFIFSSCLFPLVDEQMIKLLKKQNQNGTSVKELFGRQRLFGSLGHGLATLITGIGIDRFGYWSMFLNLFISSFLFCLFVISLIPVDGKIEKEEKEDAKAIKEPIANEKPDSSFKLISSISFILFLLMIFCSGYVRAVLSLYLPFYLQKDHHRSATLVAFAKLCQVASEVLLFLFGKHLHRLMSPPFLVLLAQVCGIGRAFAYSFLPPIGSWFYAAFGIELLKGASTALAVSGGVIMAEELAVQSGRGLETTAQGMFSGVYTGLSSAAGGVIGGLILLLLPNHSISTLFLITAIAASMTTILFGVKYYFNR